jgi:hypothetical protein
MVEPYRCVGLGPLKGQCQRDHFYGKDGATDNMLQTSELLTAPVLYAVNKSRSATVEQWKALRFLAVQLHLRTSKAAELAKVFPRFAADQIITTAIEKGELPEPKGGWRAEMMDFEGVPQSLLGLNQIACYLETSTLRCKLLSAPSGSFFITSDNPSITLNQFAADAKGIRDYVGFAQSGFQLVLPLSPSLCAFIYDPNVYKVGQRNDPVVQISVSDVEVLNSLQVQSAERCIYAHRPEAEPEVARLVARFARLRKPNSAGMKSFPQSEKETLIKFGDPTLILPRRWQLCNYLKNVRRAVGERRDPGFSHVISLVIADIEANPINVDLQQRLERVLAQLPERVPVVRRPGLSGFRLPDSPKDWNQGCEVPPGIIE